MYETDKVESIGVVGLSHLGVTASIGLASLGFSVMGFDPDEAVVRRLQGGDSIFPEPGLPELFSAHRKNTQFTSDFSEISKYDIVIFGQDTDISEEHEMKLDHIDSLIEKMDSNLKSLENLKANLADEGISIDKIPVVFQYNKRDLPQIANLDALRKLINPQKAPDFETVATKGEGVFESFKELAKIVMRDQAPKAS